MFWYFPTKWQLLKDDKNLLGWLYSAGWLNSVYIVVYVLNKETKNIKTLKTLNFIYFTTITHGYKLATRWSCWVENKYETSSLRENLWNFFPEWKTLTYLWCRMWDSNPRPPSNSVVVITPRLAHALTTRPLSTERNI